MFIIWASKTNHWDNIKNIKKMLWFLLINLKCDLEVSFFFFIIIIFKEKVSLITLRYCSTVIPQHSRVNVEPICPFKYSVFFLFFLWQTSKTTTVSFAFLIFIYNTYVITHVYVYNCKIKWVFACRWQKSDVVY